MVSMTLLLMLWMQVGVDAGPARASCDGALVTLQATPINPPANYVIEWETAAEPGVFLVVSPRDTTVYRVFLTDLDTSDVFMDEVPVFVHPGTANLNGDDDGMGNAVFNGEDLALYFAGWGLRDPINTDLDPDGDGRVTIKDYFYFCNHDVNPPNTPPSLTVDTVFETFEGESVTIPYTIMDAESTPSLIINDPSNGVVFQIGGDLVYDPDPNFVGSDTFSLQVTDGIVVTPELVIQVNVRAIENWNNIYTDILVPNCEGCHMGGARAGGLALDTYAEAQAGGNNPPGFVPGEPNASRLYLRVADDSMPLGGFPLTDEDKERIFFWILRGAPQN